MHLLQPFQGDQYKGRTKDQRGRIVGPAGRVFDPPDSRKERIVRAVGHFRVIGTPFGDERVRFVPLDLGTPSAQPDEQAEATDQLAERQAR